MRPALLTVLFLVIHGIAPSAEAQDPADSCPEVPVVALPYSDVGNTCDFSNTVNAYTGSSFCTIQGIDYPGRDAVYKIHLNEDNLVSFALTSDDADLALILVGECADPQSCCGDPSNCIVSSVDHIGSHPETIPGFSYLPGIYYLYIDSAVEPAGECGSYSLTIDGDNRSVDLEIKVEAAPSTAVAGAELDYILTVNNRGPLGATEVVVTDTLPVEVCWAPGSPDDCEPQLVWEIGNLAAGAAPAIRRLTVTVDSGAAGVTDILVNTADVTSIEGDGDFRNNTSMLKTPVVAISDLSIAKTGPPAVAAGDPMNYNYTLEIFNHGPSDATGVMAIDTLPLPMPDPDKPPAGPILGTLPMRFHAASADCTGSSEDRRVICDIGSLKAHEDATLTIQVSVTPSIGTLINWNVVNKVKVSADPIDPVLSNNQASMETRINRVADLELSKVGPDEVSADEDLPYTLKDLTYTLTVTNHGPSNSLATTLTDTLPPAVDFVPNPASGCVPSAAGASCAIRALAAGASTTPFSIKAVPVTLDPLTTPQLINSATVDGKIARVVTIVRNADHRIANVVASPDPVVAGEDLTYELAVTSDGPTDSTGGRVIACLASDLSFTPPQNDCDVSLVDFGCFDPSVDSCTSAVICPFGPPTSGSSVDLTFQVAVASSATGISSRACVDGNDDFNPSNDFIAPVVTAVERKSDLSITKSASRGSVSAGEPLTYTLSVTNHGPSDSTAGTACDTLPADLSFIPSDDGCFLVDTPGDCEPGAVSCPFSAIKDRESMELSFKVEVASSATKPVFNSARVPCDKEDPNREDPECSNNVSDSVMTAVEVNSMLSVTVGVSPDPVAAGEILSYTLFVTNDGPSDATDVTLIYPVPDNTNYVSATSCCAGWSLTTEPQTGDTAKVVFAKDIVARGETADFKIDVRVNPETAIGTVIANTATVDCPACDPGSQLIETTVGPLLTVIRAGTESGTVSSGPAGIDCGGDCTEPYTVDCRDDCTEAYTAGATVTLTATPDTFAGWTGDPGCADDPDNSINSVTMDADKTCTANFGDLTLTMTKAGNGTGTVTSVPEGIDCGSDCDEDFASFTSGEEVTLTATPDTFAGWTGDPGCTDDPDNPINSVTMDTDKTCTANFGDLTLTVTKAGNGTGTVTSVPQGIVCGSDCDEDFASFTSGEEVTLTATPDPGFTFGGWTGDSGCADDLDNPVNPITMDTDKTCTANFGSLTLTVTRAGDGGGTVTSEPPGIDCGDDCAWDFAGGEHVNLISTPDAGSTFAGWDGDPDCADGSVTMDAEMTCTAQFEPSVTLTVTRAGSGSGMITSGPAGIDCGDDCSECYGRNTDVTLKAELAPGSTFEGWTGDCPDDGSLTTSFTMDADKTCNANFGPFTLTVTRAGTGSGTIASEPEGIDCGDDCSEPYPSGTVVTLVASPDLDATFEGWSGDCPDDGSITTSFTMDADKTCSANFSPFTLTVIKAGSDGDTVTSVPEGIVCGDDCSEIYPSGTVVTLVASPDLDATFEGWSGDCPDDGSATTFFAMDADKTCIANFGPFTLTVTKAGTGGGTVTSNPGDIDCGDCCSARYPSDELVTLLAIPAPDSNFDGWTGAADCADGSVTMDTDKTCIVAFDSDQQQATCFKPTIAPILWFPFDETAGPVAADIARANDGWLHHGPIPASGKVDRALTFDGVDDYLEIPDDPSLGFDPASPVDLSIAFWIKTEGSADPDQTTMSPIDKREPGSDPTAHPHGYQLYLDGGTLGLQLNQAGFETGLFIANGDWHHVAVTVDRDDPAGGRWYLDGLEAATFDPTVVIGSLDNSAPLRIGRNTFGDPDLLDPGAHFRGSLDELQILGRALTAGEVLGIFEAGSAGVCKETFFAASDTPVCAGAEAGAGDFAICNHSTREHDYWITFAGISAAECDADIDGPAGFELRPPHTQPVQVAARSCQQMRFRADRPADMIGEGIRACYRIEVRNDATGFTASRVASLWDSRDWCAAPEGEVPAGLLPGEERVITFEVANTGETPASLLYQIETFSGDADAPSPVLSLRPAAGGTAEGGSSVAGEVLIPAGETATVSAEAALSEVRLLEFHDLVLRESSTSNVLAATGLRSVTSRPDTLVFHRGRFRVQVAGATGSAQVVSAGSDDSGLFWFFGPDHWELLVEVVDHCEVNGRFWVLAAATTEAGYTLRVTDTETGAIKDYTHPPGNAAGAIIDTDAFAICP